MTSTTPSATSQAPRQSPLTLIMNIKSEADYKALNALLVQMDSLPRNMNPIMVALDKLATVHFARFVFLDTTKLAIITSYDGSFQDYLNDFIDEIGGIFNALLAHVSDAPPLPVEQNRQAFIDYVRAHDLRCLGTFYCAYPTLGVRTILSQAADHDEA